MIDALIGAVIAVIATSALTLLAEVMANVEAASKTSLTEYEKSVFLVVKSAHPDAPATEESLLSWMKRSAEPDGL
jgi:hypothetical protein